MDRYLTVDYARSIFSVSQCLWDESAPVKLETILPPEFTTAPAPNPITESTTSPHHFSGGAIAGIVVGGIAAIVAVPALLFVLRRRQKKTKYSAVQIYKETTPDSSRTTSRMTVGRMSKTHSNGPTTRPRRTESTRVFPASVRGSLLSSISRSSSYMFQSSTLSSHNAELGSEGEVYQLPSQESTLLSAPHELEGDNFDYNTAYMGAGMTTELDTGMEGRRARIPFISVTNHDGPDVGASTPMISPTTGRRWRLSN